MAAFSLTRLTTRSGCTVELPTPGVLCVVGGNNVGKSQFLRDIEVNLRTPAVRTVVLDELEFKLHISPEQAVDWFREHSVLQSEPGQLELYAPAGGGGNPWQLSQFASFFGDGVGTVNISPLIDWFMRNLDAEHRVRIATASIGQPGVQGVGYEPILSVFRDGGLEIRLSDICKRTFGFGLTLDRANGNVLFRIGDPGLASPSLQYPTREYADAVLALPALRDQGDGVKNYLGMVLHLMTTEESVTIVDEPEAFLHPAQARALGRHLGNEALAHDRQLVAATHDRDFVLGLLETDCPTTILRINRVADENTATALKPEQVREIWDKPALRYSNILQGLFHRAVVVCEGDADCRWYAAVLDENGRRQDVPSEEVLFVPAGGKGQVATCLKALRSLDALAFAILDFDVLLDADYLVDLLKSIDAETSQVRRLVNRIVSQVSTSEQRERAKRGGLAGLPAGDVTRSAAELIDTLRDLRILIVPVGELECFDRTLGGHGPAWVSNALNARRHVSTPEADQLLRPVLESLGNSPLN